MLPIFSHTHRSSIDPFELDSTFRKYGDVNPNFVNSEITKADSYHDVYSVGRCQPIIREKVFNSHSGMSRRLGL